MSARVMMRIANALRNTNYNREREIEGGRIGHLKMHCLLQHLSH